MENTQCNQSQKKQNKKHPSKAMALFRVLRRQRKIPIENLVEFMEKHNYHISKKAIYGWECGSSNPDLQAFFLMCQFYGIDTVSYTHLRAHETDSYLVCRLLLEKKKIQYKLISKLYLS